MADINQRSRPSQYTPGLKEEWVDLIASILKFIYEDAYNDRHEVKGDSWWTIGCTSFERARAAITAAAESGRFSWLKIVDPSRRFIFSIGGVQIRYCKGDQDGRPNANVLTNIAEEAEQTQRYLWTYDPNAMKCVWRFIVNRDQEGLVKGVALKLVNTRGKTIFSGLCPLAADPATCLEWAKKAGYIKQEPVDVSGVKLGVDQGKKRKGSSGGSA